MELLQDLWKRLSQSTDKPFLLGEGISLSAREVARQPKQDFGLLTKGDVVAVVGGFDAPSVSAFLRLLDAGMIVAPLTERSGPLETFFEAGLVDAVLREGRVTHLRPKRARHPVLDNLRETGEGGIIFFSSGTTGRPKAILHAASRFLARYVTPRKPLTTLAFLLFDHIGGINTLLHMLYNGGQVIVPRDRTVSCIMEELVAHRVELLPSSPTFLRMLLMSGLLDAANLPFLKLVTYGTERMDQPTLNGLCAALPQVDFRQTYGLSELGILRVTSRARNSLWMRIGGEGVETRVDNGVLSIRAENRMLGYLNAPQPFDDDGWFVTGDVAEEDGEWLHIVGRVNDIINVGGLKVHPAQVEKEALAYPGVLFARARAGGNPITGQHVELACRFSEPPTDFAAKQRTAGELKTFLAERLPAYAVPQRIRFEDIAVSHRFKLR